MLRSGVAFGLAGAASAAHAHAGGGLTGGFAAGFAHPLGGLDHALAMVAVGLWGAFLGRPLVVALPMVFPVMMVAGGALGIAGVAAPPVELGIAVSVVTLGVMVLLALRPPVWLACAVVGVFALFHGYAHGAELPAATDPAAYSLGFVVATGLLHVAGIALGLIRTRPSGAAVLRAGGGVIALIGVLFVVRAAQA